ncbi:hypothetical protein [Aminipila sp.]|uniref:hypothetical protein n=1 Tax=Aminipila sp. TaxID=2060095 RepID=UPI001DDC7779|nr:hypothetical protein [Aminipila sp.]MBE6034280.1 hypothetical protein [Clostridiales bacterium]
MNLTDAKLKSIISFLLKNKNELITLTDYFEYQDIENGLLKIPDYLINVGIKDKIINIRDIQTYLKDYTVLFQSGCIMLDLRLHLKQLGPVSAKYMFSIKDFRFSEDYTRIYATFQEDVTSLGNLMQSMAFKAAVSGSTALQKAVKLSNCSFISIDEHNIMIDLSKFDMIKKISELFEINYADSTEGCLKFNFYYSGGDKD